MVAIPALLYRLVKLTLSAIVAGVDWSGGRWPGKGSNRVNRGVVLYYHDVPRALRAAFAQQMAWIADQAVPWSLSEPLPRVPFWVGISFDDAYGSVLEYALPELAERSLPCTVFVPMGSLGQRPMWIRSPDHPLGQEQVMSAEQVQMIAQIPGVQLGSHTVSHPDLTRVPRAAAERELRDSKERLEDLVGKAVDLLSFPHGKWTPELVELSLTIGYRRLFGIQPTCLHGHRLPRVIGRVSVGPGDWPLEFLLKLHGCYRWQACVHSHLDQTVGVP